MLINNRGEVLVARRRDIGGDAWQMPQGGIEEGELPRRAALRELKEEIGTDAAESEGWMRYDFPRELMGKIEHGAWRGQRQKWFVMRFVGSDDQIKLDTEAPEFDAWKWVAVRQLPELVVSFKRQVYVDLLAEFSHLSPQDLSELLADPMVRMTMAADGVREEELSLLLGRVAERLGGRTCE